MNPSLARLLLVGGGHAHLEILRQLTLSPRPGLQVTLVSSSLRHHYSGMAPGYLAGFYQESEISFDLPALARKAGAVFLLGKAVAVRPDRQTVVLRDRATLSYDLVSFNVGSRTAGGRDPEIQANAQMVKPISRAVQLKEKLESLLQQPEEDLYLTVVGGGAAGVEVACALRSASRRRAQHVHICLVEAGPEILTEYSPRFREKARRILRRHGVEIRTSHRVAAVEAESVLLDGGQRLPSHLTVWLTGPDASPIFENSDLAVSPDGFLLVDDGLRSVSDARIFGVGDCATMVNYPNTPKAGVYAVRQAPVLWRSLMAALEGGAAPLYQPQEKFLSILNTADGKALLHWKGFSSHSRWAWILKDWIDRRFVARYQKLT